MQTVDNHITHTAAPGAALSPIHSLWNVLIPVFVLSSRLYLPWFRVFTVILIRSELINHFYFCVRFKNRLTFFLPHNSVLIYSPTDLVLSVERCVLCAGSLCSVAEPADCVNLADMLFFLQPKRTRMKDATRIFEMYTHDDLMWHNCG